MLSLSRFSTFNIGTGFEATIPNRGNNFTSALTLPADTAGTNIGGGKYFLTQYNAKTVKSGTSWGSLSSSATLSFQPYAVGYNGSNEFIVGGQDTNYAAKFATSSDGVNWTNLAIASTNNTGIQPNCVIWDGIRWLIGGASAIFKGTTGAGLQQIISSIPTVISIASNQTRAVYVAGDNASIYYTDSLIQSVTKVTAISPAYISSVAYGNGVFVVAGQGNVYRSTDGINWSTITSPIFGTDYFQAITFYSNCFYMIGAGTNLYLSLDGINWTKKTTAIPTGGSVYFGSLMVDVNLISVFSTSFTMYTSP